MHYSPYLYEFSPLVLIQIAMTVWMLVDANRRGVEYYWYWIILWAQPFGAWAYFFAYKIRDFQGGGGGGGSGWLAGLFHRRPSLQEVRYRAEQSPTLAHRLELAERLVEIHEYAEALPHLEAMLKHEPEHCGAQFLAVQARRGLGEAVQATELLRKLIARQPSWRDYEAFRLLVVVCQEGGDQTGAVTHCRELVRVAPRLEHRCLLAELLMETDARAEARQVVEQGLADYHYTTGPARRRDGRWVGKAKQLLKSAE
jgi:hypothetical protein